MVVVTPSGGHPLRPFSAVTHQRLHQAAARPGAEQTAGAAEQAPGAPFGQPLPGGRLAWAANGAALEVLCCRTGARRAAWTFGAQARADAPPPQVTAVCSVAEAVGPAAAHLLAVGLDCGDGGGAETDGGGLVCVFDVSAAAVVRAVKLPHQVTALHVLRAPADGAEDVPAPLQAMGVLAAVGTRAGFVLLLDLCLDGPLDTDERQPGAPTYVTALEPAAEQRRREQAALGNHLCLPLNDAAVEGGLYRHRTAAGRLEHAQPADDTWVSAVHWLPQLRSLVVGLSFGCFQVWSLETLQLEYASRYEPGQLPVVGCVLLEPENDPRRFVYLWLVSSVPAYHDMNGSVASAALYALLYSERTWEHGAPVYRGLQQAGCKLVYDLTTTPEQPDAGRVSASCLLSALPLPASGADASGGADDSLAPRDATCCALAWEAWTEDGASACTCLAVFDLNLWYQAHMPHRVDAATLERCEYLRFFSLDAHSGIVMGVCVRAGAAASSGQLAATLLLDVGVQRVTFCAPQEQLLRALEAAGGAQLTQPQPAYETARRLGLVAAGAITAAEQREALLTLALERGFSSLLAACAANWASGDPADRSGCTLRALLDWLWRRAVEVVTRIDAACVPLFDTSGGAVSEDDLSALHGWRAQLDGLRHVLDTMAARAANTDGGRAELQSKSYVLRVRGLHADVVLWLCHAGLLPEQPAEDATGGGPESGELAYPGAALAEWYGERRRQLGGSLLMVDGLVEELGEPLRAVWQEDGDGLYPPRSLQALTRAYLLDGVPDVRKHRLMHYLLLDLSRLVSDEHHDLLRAFPSSFAMSPSLIKLTHGFWHLDHGSVDSALVFLLDPLVRPADLSGWQHRRVVESLLAQEAPRAALQYAQARQLPAPHAADLRLQLHVLLDNGLVTEALRYERRHRPLGGHQLADWLLAGCQRRRLLTQLMRQPLDAELERRFVQFLEDNADRECAELLHVFYLQRGRYREAAALQRRLAAAAAGPAAPERAEFRQSLHRLLPALTGRRDSSPPSYRSGSAAAVAARRRPLSAQLHQVPADVRSRATLIQEVLEQEGKKPAPPPSAVTPFRPRHNRKLPEDLDDTIGSPAESERRPLRPDVRRLLQTPPVRRAPPRCSDFEPGTPQPATPAAIRTPQSILKGKRYLESSGADTPSKQLRFGLLRGRRSLEDSRADRTPPPLATLFTPGKTPAPLRAPARAIETPASVTERSPSPATTSSGVPVRLASLFTPGKTPRPLAARVGRLPEPRVTLADAWEAAERAPTPPESVSPPRESRLSLASEPDESVFYSFEASPTAAAEQTLEIFGRERQLQLVERSWREESDGVVTLGGDVTHRSRSGDDDETLSEGLPVDEEDGQRHSTPQQLPPPRASRAPEAVDVSQRPARLISPSPRRELHPSRATPTDTRTEARQAVSVTHELSGMSVEIVNRRETCTVSRTEVLSVSAEVAPAAMEEEEGRRVSGSSGEFSPLLGNKFMSMSALSAAGSEKRRLESLETQILTEADAEVQEEDVSMRREESPERTGDVPCSEEPVAVRRTAWVTGQKSETPESGLSGLESQIVTGPEAVSAGKEACKRESDAEEEEEEAAEESPGVEPEIVRRTAWVTGTPEDSDGLDSSLAALEAQVVTGAAEVRVEATEQELANQSARETRTETWVTGSAEGAEETSPLSESYLAPPAGLQEALQRIDRALQLPEPLETAQLSSSEMTSGSRLELRLESDSESEQEQRDPPAVSYTSLQQERPTEEQPAAPSPPLPTAADRLTRSSLLRRASAGSPLLTPRRTIKSTAKPAPEKTEEPAVSSPEEMEPAATPSPKKTEKAATPSPKRTKRTTTPSPKKTEVAAPSEEVEPTVARSPEKAEVTAPSSNEVEATATPSPKKTEMSPVSSPKKTESPATPSPKKAEGNVTQSPIIEEPATPSPKRAEPIESPEEVTESPSREVAAAEDVSDSPVVPSATPTSSPLAKITTPTSSPPSRPSPAAAAVAVARAETTLSPVAEEQPSEAPPSPPQAEVSARLPTTPSSVRRDARRSGATTPRSRLSLLAAVEPLSPLPEDRSVGPAAGDAGQSAATAVPDLQEAEEEEAEEPVSATKRPRSRAGSAGPATPLRRSARTRSVSVEPEEETEATPVPAASGRRRSLRAASVESDAPPAETPATTRGRRSRQVSEEPEEPTTASKGRRTRKTSESAAGDVSVTVDTAKKGRRTRKASASEEPEEQADPDASVRTRRTRKVSEEPEMAEKPSTPSKTRRTRNASEEPEETAVLETTQRSRRTRKASEEPEETSVLETTQRTRRTRKASEEPEETSVLETTQRTRRTRKASEEPEELNVTQKSRRTRKASEEPEEAAVLDATQRSRRTRKASESSETPSVPDTARKGRRGRRAASEDPEQSAVPEETPLRATRARMASEPPEAAAAEPVPRSTSKRTRKQSETSEHSDGGAPERASKSRRFQSPPSEDEEEEEDSEEEEVPASPARNTRARSLSVQPVSPARLPTRAASEQPPESRGTSTRKRRTGKTSESTTPAASPPAKKGRASSARKAAAAAAEESDSSGSSEGEESSPPLRRRVPGRRGRASAAARRSELPAIAESAAEAMPPPAGTAAGRRRRRTVRPAPAEEEEAGSPVVLLTEEQLESMRQRVETSPEPAVSRDRRTSIARTRQRTGGRRSVRLW